jgi:hypothetical protein
VALQVFFFFVTSKTASPLKDAAIVRNVSVASDSDRQLGANHATVRNEKVKLFLCFGI